MTAINATENTTKTVQTPTERRAKCFPIVIGLVTGVGAPILSGIYAFRQKNPMLFAAAWAPILIWASLEADTEGMAREQRKYAAQITAGLMTGAVALVKKREAKKELKQLTP